MPCVAKLTISRPLFVVFYSGSGCEQALELDFFAFRMADKDSPLDDTDNEVALYCSQSTHKPSSKGISQLSNLTCMELVKYLGKWGLSQAICKAPKGLYMLCLVSYSLETRN